MEWDYLHIFKLGVSAAAAEFCICQVRKYTLSYISGRTYRKYSASKVKFSKASNHCKSVLEAAKLVYCILLKEKSLSLSKNLALVTFCELLIV